MQSSVNVNAIIENKMLTLLLRDTDVQIIKLYVNLRFAVILKVPNCTECQILNIM